MSKLTKKTTKQQVLYSIKVGMDLHPYIICLTNTDNLLDIKQLTVEKQYSNLPFQIELMLFNEEGDCVRYLKEESYSFKLIVDITEMMEQLLAD